MCHLVERVQGREAGRSNDGVQQDGRDYSERWILPIPHRLHKEGTVRLLQENLLKVFLAL